jgi:oleandomycin transport system ATP-binding protein
MDAIRAEGVVKHFGETRALDGVDITVPAGTVLGLLGPNGAGKTTMVRILATLLAPDAGRASIHGHDLLAEAHEVRRLIGLTGQYASVDDKLTGMENLILIGRLLGQTRAEARARAQALLRDFQLEEAGRRAAQTYSGGMRRRLDLAASLVGRPRILYLDEPTTGLDPRARMDLWQRVRRMVAEGVTVLLTTQYLDEADALADRIAVLDKGRVIATGTPDELKERVGEQVLTLRPEDPRRLAEVAEAVTALTGTQPDVDGRSVSVAIRKPELLTRVVRRLDDDGVKLRDFSLRGASLDDVFLRLTGHHVETGDTQQDDMKLEAGS